MSCSFTDDKGTLAVVNNKIHGAILKRCSDNKWTITLHVEGIGSIWLEYKLELHARNAMIQVVSITQTDGLGLGEL